MLSPAILNASGIVFAGAASSSTLPEVSVSPQVEAKSQSDTPSESGKLAPREETAKGKLSPVKVRVLLESCVAAVSISATAKVKLLDTDGKEVGQLSPPLKASPKLMELELVSASGSFSGKFFELVPIGDGILAYKGRRYRGSLALRMERGRLQVINILDIEDYVKSVVPSEMPSGWHMEALKAQAVSARTYALERILRSKERSFDVVATVADQLYLGADAENERTNKAVDDTKGIVILHEGSPIIAYYHSASGGRTREGDMPYLKSVQSPEDSPYQSWKVEISTKELATKISSEENNLGDIKDVSPVFNDDGTLALLKVQGTRNVVELSPEELRKLIGYELVRSPTLTVDISFKADEGGEFREIAHWMRVEVVSAYKAKEVKVRYCTIRSSFLTWPMVKKYYARRLSLVPESMIISGAGYGHGLGMSQWGAKRMAEQGSTWEEIIRHYYSGVELGHLESLSGLLEPED